MTADARMWAGRIPSTGAIVVYDPTLQLPGHSHIYVYSVNRRLIRQFEAAHLRTMIETLRGGEREAAIVEYSEWKAQHGEEFLRTEPLRLAKEHGRVASEEQHMRDAEERTRGAHRQRLAELGIDPASVGLLSVVLRQNRLAHCYRCKVSLDNTVFLECSACGWITCICGACGCGYSG